MPLGDKSQPEELNGASRMGATFTNGPILPRDRRYDVRKDPMQTRGSPSADMSVDASMRQQMHLTGNSADAEEVVAYADDDFEARDDAENIRMRDGDPPYADFPLSKRNTNLNLGGSYISEATRILKEVDESIEKMVDELNSVGGGAIDGYTAPAGLVVNPKEEEKRSRKFFRKNFSSKKQSN